MADKMKETVADEVVGLIAKDTMAKSLSICCN